MKKQLAIFAGGIILGGALVVLYLAAEGKFWNNTPPEITPPTPPAQSRQAESPAGEPAGQDVVEQDKQPPAGAVTADTSTTTDNASGIPSPGNPMAQIVPPQYLPAKLQDALRQYPALTEKDDRASLVMDVLGMTANGATKQQVAQVLGTMFHQESTTDLKLDLLDDLIMVGDADSTPTFVEGIDPSQPKEVRTKAILALENLDDNQAVPYLQQLLTDQDPDIRQAAQEALDRLNPN